MYSATYQHIFIERLKQEMGTFQISLSQIQAFLLVFLRVSAIIITVPLFDSKNIPLLFKVGLALSFSILLFQVISMENIPLEIRPIPFAIGISGEILLGIIIGMSVRIIFAGIQLAGQLVGFQMGLAIANVIDPMTSEQVSVVARLNNLMAMLIFVTINAHYWFLRAVADSFQIVQPFGFHFGNSVMEHLIKLIGNMFIVSIKVAAPIMTVLLFTSVVLGLIARTVPQLHVFIVAMPLKILIGLIFLGLSVPFVITFISETFNTLGRNMLFFLKAM